MSMPGESFRRLIFLVRRGSMEDELRREMETHRAMMDDPRAFGNTLRLRDEARDSWGWRWLDDATQDVRFAVRTLRRSPGFTLTAMVTLALGIGANSGMFSLVNGLLLRPLYERGDGVVSVYSRSTKPDGGSRGISYPNYLDLRDGTTAIFGNLAAFSIGFVGLDAGDGARRTLAVGVTDDYFRVLGQPLTIGRTLTAEESRPGAARVAIISYSLWERRGASPDIVGRTVRVDGDPFTVIGVMARGFTGTSIPGPEIWLPLSTQARLDARDAHSLSVVGRLRDGVAIASVPSALATAGSRLEQAYPAINSSYTFEISEPMRLLFMPGPGSSARTALLSGLLMIMPAIVLLVACLNLADLLLARGHVRRQELAVRASLGGGRGRLTRQLLTEGVLLSLTGGAVGLWLSTWGTSAALAALRPLLPAAVVLPEIAIDWRVLAGTLAFSLLASIIFGAWPAWTLTGRAMLTDLKRQVGDGGRQPGGISVGNALVVAQVALSLLLLASAGMFLMSAIAAAAADPGFRVEGGVIAEVDPTLAGYNQARAKAFHLALIDRVRALPGVDAVTTGSSVPFSSFGDSRLVSAAGMTADIGVDSVFTAVGRDYARTLGLQMLGGRDFNDAELTSASTERVAVVDDVLARSLWPNESALGRQIQLRESERSPNGPAVRIVGIVPSVKHSLSTPRPYPHVYVPMGQQDGIGAMTLQLRVADGQDEHAMLTTIARVVREIDPRVPVLRLKTRRDDLDSSIDVWIVRGGARACALFGAIALLLAVIGVYGVKSYVVSRRTREFGIRIATGARPRTILWQMLREGGRITTIGIAIGLVLAIGAGQILQSVLYGVNAIEPIVLLTAPLVLIAASLLASLRPALRATRVDPTIALRSE